MSNDNGYYNNTGYPYGGGAPVPPPFPGARRNRGREPYMDAAPGYDHHVGPVTDVKIVAHHLAEAALA